MGFQYRVNAKNRAIHTTAASLTGFAVLSVPYYYAINSVSSPAGLWALQAAGWLSVLTLFALILWSFRLFTRGGNWLIEVTDTFVSWRAPPGLGEQSFQIALQDIEKIVCVSSTDVEFEDEYFLLMKQGEAIRLKPTHSGININRFIQALSDNGVAFETRRKF